MTASLQRAILYYTLGAGRDEKMSSKRENQIKRSFEEKEAGQKVRLNKYLSEAGVCSRREADRLIETGKVEIDGMVATRGRSWYCWHFINRKGLCVRPTTDGMM